MVLGHTGQFHRSQLGALKARRMIESHILLSKGQRCGVNLGHRGYKKQVEGQNHVGRDQVPAGVGGADGRWYNVLMLGTKQEQQVQGLNLCTEAPQKGAPSVWVTDRPIVKIMLNMHIWGLGSFCFTSSVS